MTASTRPGHVTRMRVVGVPVSDQDAALAFYTTILGFGKTLDVPMDGGARWIEVAPPAGGTSIALVAARPGAPAGVETGIRLCAADADAFRRHLVEHGASAGEVLRWRGVPPMFAFRDQDGNGLEIVQEA
jgi:lactoylglutathione lyase